ncbi:hypothetical protein E2C01_088251 [Portunus trituberculatus]|uniref:Uncharacterized protein n=1 Tax=Portunus trituberculatus TaxID=210409 RepID=A0A5B7JDY8_PORTR|nr:hypothetical protein [Portunus trituberculatus]
MPKTHDKNVSNFNSLFINVADLKYSAQTVRAGAASHPSSLPCVTFPKYVTVLDAEECEANVSRSRAARPHSEIAMARMTNAASARLIVALAGERRRHCDPPDKHTHAHTYTHTHPTATQFRDSHANYTFRRLTYVVNK